MQSPTFSHCLVAWIVDNKFYAYSRRNAKGKVDKPLPVYANSAILRVSAKYFEGCKPLVDMNVT